MQRNGYADKIFIFYTNGWKSTGEEAESVSMFLVLGKVFDRIKYRGVLWQVLRMYDVGGKLIRFRSYILICVKVKGNKSE